MAYNKETGMYEGYIYCIENTINNRKYIGQTLQTIHKRWLQHTSDAKCHNDNYAIHLAMNKYGVENFVVCQLEQICCHTESELKNELNKLEHLYVMKFDTYNNGYNLTVGGDSNGERDKKIIDIYDLDGNLLYVMNGCNYVDDYFGLPTGSCNKCCLGKRKTSGGMVFRFHGDPFDKYDVENDKCKHIFKFTLDGVFLKEFKNANQAALSIGGKATNSGILDAIKKHNMAYGYYWSFTNEIDLNLFVNKPKYNQLAINQYTTDDVFVMTYESMSEAKRVTGATNIHACCIKTRQTAGGFKWFYADDPEQPDKSKIITSN